MHYLLFVLFFFQQPDTWTVVKPYPHLSRVHNSIEVTKRVNGKDSTLFIQFDFPPTAARFPEKGDKITFVNQRRGILDGKQSFEVINIIKPRQ